MPLKKIRLAALAATIAAFAAVPGSASAASLPTMLTGCGLVPVATVFAGFGDTNWYTLAPNGTFINNAAGWTFTGPVSVVPDTEPFDLLDWLGAKAIKLGPGPRLPRSASAVTTRTSAT
jgi:hypothetical protein